MDALAKAGHHVIYQSSEKSNYKEALETPTDLVIAAGGDGTIEKIAKRHAATTYQIALAWVLRQSRVIAIPKASKGKACPR